MGPAPVSWFYVTNGLLCFMCGSIFTFLYCKRWIISVIDHINTTYTTSLIIFFVLVNYLSKNVEIYTHCSLCTSETVSRCTNCAKRKICLALPTNTNHCQRQNLLFIFYNRNLKFYKIETRHYFNLIKFTMPLWTEKSLIFNEQSLYNSLPLE